MEIENWKWNLKNEFESENEMKNEKWKMKMKNEKWKNEKWKMKNEKWKMKNEKWTREINYYELKWKLSLLENEYYYKTYE